MNAALLDVLVDMFDSEMNETGDRRAALDVVVGFVTGRAAYDPRIDDVVAAVGRAFGLTPEILLSRSRGAYVARPRAIAYWICHRNDIGWWQLAKAFGRHHSVIMDVCNGFRERLITDEVLRKRVASISASLDNDRRAA